MSLVPGSSWLRSVRDSRVRRRLLRDEDSREDIVDEVHHHWVVYVLPWLEGLLAVLLVVLALGKAEGDAAWVLLVAASAVAVHASYRALLEFMDVFVITNMRVFRVTGVLSSKHATTPLARILDITVDQPFLGLVLGYGHFTFESAAQEQGLRDIRFVADPLGRDLTIQRHVQQSGLRGPRPLGR